MRRRVLRDRRPEGDAELEEREAPRAGDFFAGVPLDEDSEAYGKEDYDEEILGRDTVGQWMTAEISSVDPESTLDLVCRRMLDENIHRILVMDGKKKLLGMISTSDVVRLVALEPAAASHRTNRARH